MQTTMYALCTRLLGTAALAGILAQGASAMDMADATVLHADKVDWSEGPASIPPGAEAARLYGDPSSAELFALRLKLPADYHIPPHTHPRPEIVTVISGTFLLGHGEAADREATEPLPAGSFFALEPGHPHFAYADGETVIQLNSSGPWALDYIDPVDDPRLQN